MQLSGWYCSKCCFQNSQQMALSCIKSKLKSLHPLKSICSCIMFSRDWEIIFFFILFMPKEASVMCLQTITGNLMDLRERRSAVLMRNPERYSPSATAWLRWGPEACWHDRLDVDYLAVFKPTNRRGTDSRWASAPRSPGCESLWAAPRRACWSSPWWWRCSSSWGCSRGLTSSSSASCSTRLKAQLQGDRDEGGWQDEGSWKLLLLVRKRLGMQRPWPITDWQDCFSLTHKVKKKVTHHGVFSGSEVPTWGYFYRLKLSSRYDFKKCLPAKEKKSTRLSVSPEVKLHFPSLA